LPHWTMSAPGLVSITFTCSLANSASARSECRQRFAAHSDPHRRRNHPQHLDFVAAGAAAAEPQPHPVPPVDFTSASSVQQPLVPDGAGPPQQVCGAPPGASDVSAAPRFVVFD
jgi:hypothetical protein